MDRLSQPLLVKVQIHNEVIAMTRFFQRSMFAFLFLFSAINALASSATISATQDVYVRMDVPTTNKNNDDIAIRRLNGGSSGKNNKAIIQFKYERGASLNDAMLMLDLKIFQSSANQSIFVWGVKDGYYLEEFDQATTTYSHWTSLFDSSGDGTNNNRNRLHDGNPSNTGGAASLGTFSVSRGDVGQTVSFTSDAFVDFVQSDTNGIITILLTANGDNNKAVKFASIEDTTYSPPRLFLSADDEVYNPDADTYIRYNDNINYYHDEQHIFVKLSGGGRGSTTRVGIMKFDIDKKIVAKSSDLLLDVSMLNNGSSAEFYVWGLVDSVGDPANIEQYRWNNWLGIVDGSIDGVNQAAASIYGNEPLGRFSIDSGDLYKTVSFSSDALNNLINDDTNGIVRLMLTRVTNSGSLNSAFASNEHASLEAPRLVVRPELERDTLTSDAEIKMIDVDSDNEDDMVLVVNLPDGGGMITADPFVIADYFIATGYGLGNDYDFYNALSSSQQISLSNSLNVVVNLDCATSFTPASVSATDLYNAVDSMASGREYQVGSFTVSTTLEADIESGDIALEVSMESCTLLEVTYGNFSATIDGPSAQAAFVVTEDRIAIGAEYNYYTATVGYTSNNGSQASVSASAGGGVFVDISLGNNGVYGASFPVTGNVSVSLYISADDAEAIFNDIEFLLTDSEGYIEELLGEDALENIDMNNAEVVAMVNTAQQTTVYVEKTVSEVTIFVRQYEDEALIVIDAVNGVINSQLASNALRSIANSTSNAADSLITYGNSISNFVSSTWTDATGWVEGTVENVSKGVKKWFNNLF